MNGPRVNDPHVTDAIVTLWGGANGALDSSMVRKEIDRRGLFVLPGDMVRILGHFEDLGLISGQGYLDVEATEEPWRFHNNRHR